MNISASETAINAKPKLTTDARFLFSAIPLYTSIAPTSPRNNIAVPPITLSRFCSAGLRVIGEPMGDLFMWSKEERAYNLFYDSKLAEQRLSENLSVEDEDMQLRNFFTTGKLSWNPRFHNPHLDKWLHRIKIPTMIIWGDSDKIFPPAYGEAYKTAIPGSQLLIIPDCGHVPHQEKLAEFLAGIDTFTNGAK